MNHQYGTIKDSEKDSGFAFYHSIENQVPQVDITNDGNEPRVTNMNQYET